MSEPKFKISLEHSWKTFSFGIGVVAGTEKYFYVEFAFWNFAIGVTY